MTVTRDRLPLLAGTTMLGLSAVLLLVDADLLAPDWRGWWWPMMCLVAGAGLLGAARDSPTAYAGVLSRLSGQVALPVWVLRGAVLLTAPLAGAGVAIYTGLALAQVTERDSLPSQVDWRRSVATGLLGLAFVLACVELGVAGGGTVLWTVLMAGSGLSLFWWVPEGVKLSDTTEQDVMLRFHLSLLLTAGAVIYLLGKPGLFSDSEDGTALPLVASIGVLAIPVLFMGVRWLRTSRALTRERMGLALANERAELAGRVHDEVMQTLALIQDRADEPAEVRRLARRQERDLRSWLLAKEPAAAPSHSVASALRAMAAEVEDAHGVEIDVVTVGDGPLDPRAQAVILAAREAMINAAKHASESPISLFGEIEEKRLSAYVRDRGPGFDLDSIPADRHGVRESILARMERHGGHATIRTAPGGGCEVQLIQERQR